MNGWMNEWCYRPQFCEREGRKNGRDYNIKERQVERNKEEGGEGIEERRKAAELRKRYGMKLMPMNLGAFTKPLNCSSTCSMAQCKHLQKMIQSDVSPT